MPTPIGIDLGTTFSVIACYRNDRVEIISDPHGQRLIPSMVYYDPNTGKAFVGRLAYDKSREYFPNLLRDAKRVIGRRYDDQVVQNWSKLFYPRDHLAKTDAEMAAFQVTINGKTVLKTPEEVSSEVLKYLVEYAGEYLDESINEVVISVPAYFSGAQRKATRKAAQLAGLKAIKLISEPVAGALHYVKDRNANSKLLVFDFGGGTLDVSLIEVDQRLLEVKAVSGDTLLGGRNIDEKLFNFFYKHPKKMNEKNIQRCIRRMEKACISMKEYLQDNSCVMKIIDCYDGDNDLELKLDIETFERLNKDIFEKTIDIVDFCLREAKWSKKDIEKVILVGGSTRIPKIRQLLHNYFGERKIKTDSNPDEAVAGGACVLAAVLSKGYANLERCRVGEVTPLSLGLALYGDLMQVIIPKNSKLPAQGTVDRVTVSNDLSSVKFSIYEGERKNCLYNNELGMFVIENLPKGAAGDVKFTVNFSLDEDGILKVTASEKSTGQNNSLTVAMEDFGLSEQQIKYNIEEANKQKEEDDIFEAFILKRNYYLVQCGVAMYKKGAKKALKKRCDNFIKFANNLNFKDIVELSDRFLKLKI